MNYKYNPFLITMHKLLRGERFAYYQVAEDWLKLNPVQKKSFRANKLV